MIKALFKRIGNFLARRLMTIGRILIGIFMILIGAWFILAPITQQFLTKADALAQSPYLWLIVPVGILQIAIGISILRPIFR